MDGSTCQGFSQSRCPHYCLCVVIALSLELSCSIELGKACHPVDNYLIIWTGDPKTGRVKSFFLGARIENVVTCPQFRRLGFEQSSGGAKN